MKMVMLGSGWRLAAGLTLLVLLLGCAYAAATSWLLHPSGEGAGDGKAAREGPTGPATVAVIENTEPRQLAAFVVLRSPPEGMPAELREILRHPVFGVNFALAQRLPVPLRRRYWIVPGRGTICLIARTAKGMAAELTCSSTAQILQEGLVATTLAQPLHSRAPAPRLIVGMAPDGESEASIRTGRETVTAEIDNGVFVVHDRAADPPDSVDFR
jgi:hypothetical protein